MARDPKGRYNDYIASTSITPRLMKLREMEEAEAKLFWKGGLAALVVTLAALALVFTPLRFLLETQGFAWTTTAYILILIANDLYQQSHGGKGFMVATNLSRKASVLGGAPVRRSSLFSRSPYLEG